MPNKIMLIRHAEKPEDGGAQGVSLLGAADDHELIVRGWQRAGALVRLFNPVGGRPAVQGLAVPTAVFASAAVHGENSLRPQHTVMPLCEDLRTIPNIAFVPEDHAGLAEAILAQAGPVLVSWHHEDIPGIVHALAPGVVCPAAWPHDRFDLVWVLDRAGSERPWAFSQIPQLLLPHDSQSEA